MHACVLGVFAQLAALALGMIGVIYFAYVGVVAISERSLHTRIGFRASGPWFPQPLIGAPAVIAGFSFLCLAFCIAAILITSYAPLFARLPSSLVRTRWWLIWIPFALWTVLTWLANYLGKA